MNTLIDPKGRPHRDLAGILRRIRDDPAEDTHRLVLADFLDDRGDRERGDAAHAQVIRLQCEQAQTPPFSARWYELGREAQELLVDNFGPLMGYPGRAGAALSDFARGLPTTVVVGTPSWLRRVGRVFELGWIETIELQGGRDVGVLARQSALRRVTGLRLLDRLPGELERLLGEADVSHVRRWSFHSDVVTGPDVVALADAVRAGATAAEELDLSWSPLSLYVPRAVVELARRMRRGRLALSDTGVGARVLRGLTARPPADPDRGVRRLELSEEPVTDSGLHSLAAWPGSCHLEFLDVSYPHRRPGISDGGVEALAHSGYLAGLRELRLAGTGVGDRGVAALARVPPAWDLRRVDLSDTAVTPVGVRLLRDRFPECRIDPPGPGE